MSTAILRHPGPWRSHNGPSFAQIVDAEDKVLALVMEPGDGTGKLMAAAPELHAGCTQALLLLQGEPTGDIAAMDVDDVIAILKAALQKSGDEVSL